MFMTTLQITGAEAYESQMEMHTSTSNTYISLTRGFQTHISYPTRKNDVMDQVKERKRSNKQKWTDNEYHVQNNKYLTHTAVNFLAT